MMNNFGALVVDFHVFYGIDLLAEDALKNITWPVFILYAMNVPKNGAFPRIIEAEYMKLDDRKRKIEEQRANQRELLKGAAAGRQT